MPRTAPEVSLLPRQRSILERLGRSSTEEHRLVERARIIVMSAAGMRSIDQATALGVDVQRVTRWRHRWVGEMDRLLSAELEPVSDGDLEALIVDVLGDNYRSGTPPKFTAEQVAQIISLACEQPKEIGIPVTHWTAEELRREAKKRQIVDDISRRQVARFFGGGRDSSAPFAVLAQPENHGPSTARARSPHRVRRLRDGGATRG